jgi:hypothetical protein
VTLWEVLNGDFEDVELPPGDDDEPTELTKAKPMTAAVTSASIPNGVVQNDVLVGVGVPALTVVTGAPQPLQQTALSECRFPHF